jgi:organic radical activating enzyme
MTNNHAEPSVSKFMSAAEQMKQQLGHGLCLAKWKQVSLHLPTGLTNSCYHPPLHPIPVEGLDSNPGQLHNTPYKKQQRVIMLQDQRPSECQYCWNMEDLGELSDRHYRSGEPWAAVDFDKIANSTGLEDDVIPSYVEVNFNNACNLSCSYCSPQFSSTWAQEVERHGGYPTKTAHNSPEHFQGDRRVIPAREHNPYVEAFWQWWPTLYPQLRHFRMTGGEPLMDRNTYRVFDWVLENPNPELHLNVTSNFSVEDALFEKYIGYVKQLCTPNIEHFMQYVSLDSGLGPQAEYIRHGMSADRVVGNVNRYLTEIPYRNSLTFIITMNNLSVTGFRDYMEWILVLRKQHSSTYQRVWFDTPVLRQPAWQSLQILPEGYADMLEQTADWMEKNLEISESPFQGFKDYEVQRLRRDIAWMRQGQAHDHSHNKADFYRFFSEHDRRRNTNFLNTFPSMTQWWKECEYHAKNT